MDSRAQLRSTDCPYRGLQPFGEEDQSYFFGREEELSLIENNLYGARLTILHGAAGVGKSSLIRAGLVPRLRQNEATIVTFRDWVQSNVFELLRTKVLYAIGSDIETASDEALRFDEFLLRCTRDIVGPLFFIFDQFDEFFFYHPSEKADSELARALNRRELDAHFLFSIREENLGSLDRLQQRVPRLFDNLIRLRHLGREGARDAIVQPIKSYNSSGSGPSVEIESALVEEVIVQVGSGVSTQPGELRQVSRFLADGALVRIESVFLQIVLTRLWEEEIRDGSTLLRRSTFEKLGGAQGIIQSLLDRLMDRLSTAEQKISISLFSFLVTPSGARVALTLADLRSYTGLPGTKVESVLEKLVAPQTQVLRAIRFETNQTRYEVVHDVLASATVNWRARQTEKTLRIARRRARTIAAIAFCVLLSASLITIVGWRQSKLAETEAHRARETRRPLSESRPDNRYLISLSTGGHVFMFDVEKGVVSRLVKIGLVEGAQLSPDGSILVTVGPNHQARLWSFPQLDISAELGGHTGRVIKAAFSPDNSRIATGSDDHTARLWDSTTGKLILVCEADGPVTDVQFSRDGRTIMLISGHGQVSNWDVNTGERLNVSRMH